ncbi:MAG: hypothetical protein ACLPR9_15370 [Acidimicrobiales bacterium]
MDFGTIDFAYAQHLATRPPEEDGPIWMVNFMRYKERADYGEGEDSGISGREADDRYAPTEVLADIGADVAYFGDSVGPDGGPDPEWHRMGIVHYPTRRSFIDMQSRQDFQEKRVHKDAGMDFTIIMCSLPTGPVQGEPDGSGIVRFTAFPAGSSPSGPVAEGAAFEVEGTVVGDDRRWGRLEVSWSDRQDDLPEGAFVVRSLPFIDRIRSLIGDAPGG